jgi:hypothetical protein
VDFPSRILIQYILENADASIQIAFINTLIVVQQRYPNPSVHGTNDLLDFGKQTSKPSPVSCTLVNMHFAHRIGESGQCSPHLLLYPTTIISSRSAGSRSFCHPGRRRSARSFVLHRILSFSTRRTSMSACNYVHSNYSILSVVCAISAPRCNRRLSANCFKPSIMTMLVFEPKRCGLS